MLLDRCHKISRYDIGLIPNKKRDISNRGSKTAEKIVITSSPHEMTHRAKSEEDGTQTIRCSCLDLDIEVSIKVLRTGERFESPGKGSNSVAD